MTFRLATIADNPGIKQCLVSAFAVYTERIGKKPEPMISDYTSYIKDNGVYVLDRDGGIAGVLVLLPREDHLYVEAIAVSREQQGKGLGKKLITCAERVAREKGLAELQLCTNMHMHESQKFYAKLGFVAMMRKTVQGYDRIYYCKKLVGK